MAKNVNGVNVTAPTEAFDLNSLIAARRKKTVSNILEVKLSLQKIIRICKGFFSIK